MPRWFLWTLAALGSWGLWAIASKVIGDALSPAHSQALSTLGMLPVLAALAWSRHPTHPGTRSRGIAYGFAAGLVTCLGNLAYYAALQSGNKAATVIPLTALYPVVTITLAVLLLRERLHRGQVLGICLSLLATYLFNIPSERGFLSPAILLALPPIALWGLSGFLQKLSTNHVSGETSAVWFLAAFVPVSLAILLIQPVPTHSLTPRLTALAAALGLFLAFGNYAVLAAFAQGGRASVIAPLGGLYPLVSLPIAIQFFGERPSLREGLGFTTALVAVLALSLEPRSQASASATPISPSAAPKARS
jgi:transporter family protein